MPLISFELRIRKKKIIFQVQEAFCTQMQNFRGSICKTWCWLTKEFDGGSRLINVIQFQRDNWGFVNFKEVIDETYKFQKNNYLFTHFLINSQTILIIKNITSLLTRTNSDIYYIYHCWYFYIRKLKTFSTTKPSKHHKTRDVVVKKSNKLYIFTLIIYLFFLPTTTTRCMTKCI